MVTLLPLTTRPLWLAFWVQPTPLPWSARHNQRLSPMTLLALMVTQFVVVPAVAPPTRLQRSYKQIGSAEKSSELVAVPTSKSDDEAVVPASKMIPVTLTPGTLEIIMEGRWLTGISVGYPNPRMTVSAFVTRILLVRLYTPGVKIRFCPAFKAALIVPALSTPGRAR